jgi:hypothetical protein
MHARNDKPTKMYDDTFFISYLQHDFNLEFEAKALLANAMHQV